MQDPHICENQDFLALAITSTFVPFPPEREREREGAYGGMPAPYVEVDWVLIGATGLSASPLVSR